MAYLFPIFRTVVGTVVGVALMSMAAYAMTIKTCQEESKLRSLFSLRCYLVVGLFLII